ncbi:MAG: hypothetical protein ACOYOE_14780 [Chlorobium sp.]
MNIDYKILATLSDPVVKQVLHAVVKGGAVRHRQLLPEGVNHKAVLHAIDYLKTVELIKETQAPIDDLKTYFVTASGLQADRMVKG